MRLTRRGEAVRLALVFVAFLVVLAAAGVGAGTSLPNG